MVILLVFLVTVLSPIIGHAAYQNPSIVSHDVQTNGYIKLDFIFTGNAGEPAVRRSFIVSSSTTATVLRNWVDDNINELDKLFAAGSLPALQLGQIVPRLASVPPVPTAKDIWNAKLDRYLRVKDSGIAAIATDLAALKADLEATYQAGFIN